MKRHKPPKPSTPLERIATDLHDIVALLKLLLQRHIAQSATMTIGGFKMVTLDVGKTATAKLREWSGPSGTGVEVASIGPVTYTSDDVTVATVDAGTGLVTAVASSKLDASGNSIPVNISGVDAGNGLNASAQLTVNQAAPPPPVAVSATLDLTPNP